MLSQTEKKRYGRQITLEGFGETSQQKLKDAKVLVVGAGALGSPVLNYLAAAGVGTLGIVDGDTVDLSNLHRQVLFTTNDTGKPKAEAAALRLKELNDTIRIDACNEFLSKENVLELFAAYDIIVDGTDNFPTRYLINDACVILNKVNVHGSVVRFAGTVSTFNYQSGPNYRDLFPVPPRPEDAPSCAEAGVIGVIPSVIGSLQAMEVIKIITGIGEVMSGKFLRYDLLTNRHRGSNERKVPAIRSSHKPAAAIRLRKRSGQLIEPG